MHGEGGLGMPRLMQGCPEAEDVKGGNDSRRILYVQWASDLAASWQIVWGEYLQMGRRQQARWRGRVGRAIHCQGSRGASLLRLWDPHGPTIVADALRHGAEGL